VVTIKWQKKKGRDSILFHFIIAQFGSAAVLVAGKKEIHRYQERMVFVRSTC
jgi:hypothetical protein